jgi:hypothetical protein
MRTSARQDNEKKQLYHKGRKGLAEDAKAPQRSICHRALCASFASFAVNSHSRAGILSHAIRHPAARAMTAISCPPSIPADNHRVHLEPLGPPAAESVHRRNAGGACAGAHPTEPALYSQTRLVHSSQHQGDGAAVGDRDRVLQPPACRGAVEDVASPGGDGTAASDREGVDAACRRRRPHYAVDRSATAEHYGDQGAGNRGEPPEASRGATGSQRDNLPPPSSRTIRQPYSSSMVLVADRSRQRLDGRAPARSHDTPGSGGCAQCS